MSCKAGTVLHAPGLGHGQNGKKGAFAQQNRWNAIPAEGTLHRGARSKEAGCSLSCAWKSEGCQSKTPGYDLSKPHAWMPFLPKWHIKKSSDKLGTRRIRCTSVQPTQAADSRANCRPATTSARNITHLNREKFRCSPSGIHLFTGQICLPRFIPFLCCIF